MKDQAKFEFVSVAYRSRFLFRTDAEYREALGVSFETVANKRDSERDVDFYYGVLSREAERIVEKPLDELVGAYVDASELYLSLDWGDRSQMASRRRFCRMLFRYCATAGWRLSVAERVKFKLKDDDGRLLAAFFPDGVDGAPAVDIGFIVLFAFGVVRPWGVASARGRDIGDKEAGEAVERLRGLIGVLKEDMPRLGSTEKPLVFDVWLECLDLRLREGDLVDTSPVWLTLPMMEIICGCRSLVVAEEQRMEGERLPGIDMPGIWVDDADGGRTRFWIFPDNMQFGFCYMRDGAAWRMKAYELRGRFRKDSLEPDSFVLLEPRANLGFLFTPERAVDSKLVASGGCEVVWDETTGEIVGFKLEDFPRAFPEWLDWREWARLSPEDERYREFGQVLKAVYDPESHHSAVFENLSWEFTDLMNNIVGRDGKYLYIYDRQPRRFRIRASKDERFVYVGVGADNILGKALFEFEISEEHPLYAIPLDIKEGAPGWLAPMRFWGMFDDVENVELGIIAHSGRCRFPRLIFPEYGVTVALDMAVLGTMGVRMFTKRPF